MFAEDEPRKSFRKPFLCDIRKNRLCHTMASPIANRYSLSPVGAVVYRCGKPVLRRQKGGRTEKSAWIQALWRSDTCDNLVSPADLSAAWDGPQTRWASPPPAGGLLPNLLLVILRRQLVDLPRQDEEIRAAHRSQGNRREQQIGGHGQGGKQDKSG